MYIVIAKLFTPFSSTYCIKVLSLAHKRVDGKVIDILCSHAQIWQCMLLRWCISDFLYPILDCIVFSVPEDFDPYSQIELCLLSVQCTKISFVYHLYATATTNAAVTTGVLMITDPYYYILLLCALLHSMCFCLSMVL